MTQKIKISRADMAECAQQLLVQPCHIWTFIGALGAGKTTLVQEMLMQLGVTGPIASPTYTYVCVYKLADGRIVYHFDLYRLSSLQEFIQAGFDEYLYDENALCFIEWPDILENMLSTQSVCKVIIDYVDEESRLINYQVK